MSARLDGAKMRASWPSCRSRTARRRTWSFTPPGDAKSYGETRPTFMVSRSRCARPDAMRDVPLLRMLPDEALDLAQELLRGAHLVGAWVACRLREHVRRSLGHVRIVRQSINAHRQERCAETQCNRRRPQRDRRQLAEERHQVAGFCDVAVDRGDHHLLLAQSLEHLADAAHVERQNADPKARSCVAVPLEK